MQSSPWKYRLSVVVIGHNEGSRLQKCLTSIMRMQPIDGFSEIIYVDSASTDDSVSVALSSNVKVLYATSSKQTAALGRNIGWRAAQGEIILFLDGDTILDPNFVSNSLSKFVDSNIAVICGNRRELYPEASIYNRVVDLDWIFPPGDVKYCGGDALIRRSVLEEVGGYDASLLAGEEPEMCWRICSKGYRILRVDALMTHHDVAMKSFSQYWKRAFRSGYGYAEVCSRFADTQDPIFSSASKKNKVKASIILVGFVLWIFFIWHFKSAYIVLAVFPVILLLVFRTAIKARWKSERWGCLLLYACHSLFIHIPIFFGQLAFLCGQHNRRWKFSKDR